MNIKEEHKNNYISVKKLITIWNKGGLKAVENLLLDSSIIIEEGSWIQKIKKLLEEKKYSSTNAEIKLISKLFKYGKSERKERDPDQKNR